MGAFFLFRLGSSGQSLLDMLSEISGGESDEDIREANTLCSFVVPDRESYS
ncbi:hypothetical protein [Arthrobacter sp. MYb224]|uniref:hypothetical protein n=1 Tax=Arthrobacter sp. MYb224 TaxID=1848600 RepID=UPI0015E337A2|nr:hypothetical protein [Arthrobacter sp. MYb224]